MRNGIARSPLFYVGDKYKLVKEIKTHFPNNIKRLIEPFVGGGVCVYEYRRRGVLVE